MTAYSAPLCMQPTALGNRYSVLSLGIQCARLTRPLAPKIFSKDGAKDRVPAEKIPFASQEYFSSGTACHTVCGSQQNFMAVPVSLLPALVSHGRYCFIPHGMASYVQLGV